MHGPGLFEEIRRRHVWRMAIAYAVVGWLLIQIATQVFPFFGIPDWAVRWVILLIALGFPLAVVLAWVFEFTPEGIRRTEPAGSPDARPEHESRQIGRKLNATIIAVLVLAVALLGWRLLVLRHAPAPTVAAPGVMVATKSPDTAVEAAGSGLHVAPTIPEKSVAVLPFANESGNKDEQFFSDGLSEDLITALSQFAELKVISRNSAFQLRDSKDSSAEIGKLLGVAHLLEGSVQRAGEEVRITATLVNAADGSIVWSQRHDKPYKDLFALQDAITAAVADALKAKLLTTPGAVVQSDRPPSGNLDAYTAYQHGMVYVDLNTEVSLRQAIDAFNDAIRLDPQYAAAYAQMSQSWLGLTQSLSDSAKIAQAQDAARKASDAALKLGPDSSLAHQARARLLQVVDMDWRGAEAEAQRALQLAPNDAYARFRLAGMASTLGQSRRAVELTRQALDGNPRNANWYTWLSVYLAALGEEDDARQAVHTAIALQPGASAQHEQLAIIEILQGHAKAALAAAQQETDPIWREFAMALALQIGPDRAAADTALKKLVDDLAGPAPYQIAEVYALRHDPDAMFHWLDRAWTQRDPGVSYLLFDPLILRYRDDPRFAAFAKKVGLPTTTDAVAMK